MQQRHPDQVQERGAQLQPARGEHVGQRHLHQLSAPGPNSDSQHQHTHTFRENIYCLVVDRYYLRCLYLHYFDALKYSRSATKMDGAISFTQA